MASSAACAWSRREGRSSCDLIRFSSGVQRRSASAWAFASAWRAATRSGRTQRPSCLRKPSLRQAVLREGSRRGRDRPVGAGLVGQAVVPRTRRPGGPGRRHRCPSPARGDRRIRPGPSRSPRPWRGPRRPGPGSSSGRRPPSAPSARAPWAWAGVGGQRQGEVLELLRGQAVALAPEGEGRPGHRRRAAPDAFSFSYSDRASGSAAGAAIAKAQNRGRAVTNRRGLTGDPPTRGRVRARSVCTDDCIDGARSRPCYPRLPPIKHQKFFPKGPAPAGSAGFQGADERIGVESGQAVDDVVGPRARGGSRRGWWW
jgi:hypothetical protein